MLGNSLTIEELDYTEEYIWERIESKIMCEAYSNLNNCWNWTGAMKRIRYPVLSVSINGKLSLIRVSRLIIVLTEGSIEAGTLACHICHNPRCVRPLHIYPGSHLDNLGLNGAFSDKRDNRRRTDKWKVK